MSVVFDGKGDAYLLTGPNHEGAETWVKLGTPEAVPGAEVDEKGDGTPAYSTQQPTPENPTA